MKMHFINIVPFFPDRLDYMALEAKRLLDCAGIDSPAYCMSLHPEGNDPLEKPRYYAAQFGALQEKLRDSGIRPGILVQSVMGHGWRGQVLCGRDWQYTVNINGSTAYRMCPLDQNFLGYVQEVFRLLGALRPAFFLTDDDIRLINNSESGLECFCPLHLAAFHERSSRRFTADELREYMRNAPPGDETAEIFDRIRRESLLNLVSLIRSAIDETDENIPCGCCAGGREYMLMEALCKVLAGKNTPFLRIHNAMYLEEKTLDFPLRMYHTCLMKKAAGSIPILLDEADTYPHNRFSKSAVGMHSHITGGILNGVNGAKLWLTNTQEPEAAESRQYEKILGEHRGFYDKLLGLCSRIDWRGPRTVLPPKELQWRPAAMSGYYLWHDWQWQYLNRFGIPGSYGDFDGERVTLLSGEMAAAMSGAELERILKGKVLLDGDAAFAVQEKGLSRLIGAVPERKEFRFSCEKMVEDGCRMRFLNDFSAPFYKDVKGEIISRLVLFPFNKSPECRDIAPGSFYFENSAGGRVAVTAVSMKNIISNMLAPLRKQWLIRLLRRIDPSSVPAYVENNQDIYFRYGVTADGEQIAALVNLSFDRLEQPRISFLKPFRRIWRLAPAGNWEEQPFTLIGGSAVLECVLSTYENIIWKID